MGGTEHVWRRIDGQALVEIAPPRRIVRRGHLLAARPQWSSPIGPTNMERQQP